jgi:hypothetical protein
MSHKFSLLVASCLVAGAFATTGLSAPKGAYQPPRLSFGQPDLGDYWSNASLTKETRSPALGNRLVYTPAEVKKIESGAAEEFVEGNEPTDPNAPPPKKGGEIDKNVRPEFAAAGGNVGGYNIGWLDPGNLIMRVHGEPRTSILTTVNGEVPKPKTGAAQPAAFRRGRGGMGSFDNPENRSLGERCIIGFGRNGGPPMLANGFYNNNYHFVQTPTKVAIETEMVHDTRLISLTRKTHLPPNIRPWFGDSIGHWEGNTLVVETTNIPKAQAYHGSWKNLTVTERFTRTAPDRMLYQFTIHDPTMWDADWGGEYEFHPLKGRVEEYACHEGNYALEDMLAGARQAEKDAKIKSASAK